MQNNDKLLLVEVYNKEPIVVKQFDTPLQIAHRFCNDNKLEMKYCKSISQIVIRIMKTYSGENQQLEEFKKYYQDVAPFLKKKVYTLNEILNNQEKENQQQQLQLQDQYYSFNKNEENKTPPPIVYKSPKDIQLLEQKQPKNKIDTKKLEDLGRKLYQNILSPSPEQSPQLNYSQTTKHVSILQRQLQQSQQISNNQKKSVERLNKSTHLRLFKQNSSFLDSAEKKKQLPIFNHHNNTNTNTNKKKVQPRSISNGKQRCKTEAENDRLQRLGYKIFQLMDSDRDGGISPTAIDLSAISDEMLNFLIPILMEIDNKQLKLNAFQFYQLFECQFDKLDQTAKSRILNN